jgi:hypothetical protein
VTRTYVPRRTTPARCHRKSFWGTADELDEIERAAKLAGLSAAAFIREMTLVAARSINVKRKK